MDSLGVSLSRIFLDFFPKPVYSTMVAEKFQSYGVKTTDKCICESKNWIWSFLLMPSSKTLTWGFYHYLLDRRKLPIPPEERFQKIYFFPAERGGDYGGEKMTKIKHTRVLVTSSNKLHHLCNLYIHGFCFVVP